MSASTRYKRRKALAPHRLSATYRQLLTARRQYLLAHGPLGDYALAANDELHEIDRALDRDLPPDEEAHPELSTGNLREQAEKYASTFKHTDFDDFDDGDAFDIDAALDAEIAEVNYQVPNSPPNPDFDETFPDLAKHDPPQDQPRKPPQERGIAPPPLDHEVLPVPAAPRTTELAPPIGTLPPAATAALATLPAPVKRPRAATSAHLLGFAPTRPRQKRDIQVFYEATQIGQGCIDKVLKFYNYNMAIKAILSRIAKSQVRPPTKFGFVDIYAVLYAAYTDGLIKQRRTFPSELTILQFRDTMLLWRAGATLKEIQEIVQPHGVHFLHSVIRSLNQRHRQEKESELARAANVVAKAMPRSPVGIQYHREEELYRRIVEHARRQYVNLPTGVEECLVIPISQLPPEAGPILDLYPRLDTISDPVAQLRHAKAAEKVEQQKPTPQKVQAAFNPGE